MVWISGKRYAYKRFLFKKLINGGIISAQAIIVQSISHHKFIGNFETGIIHFHRINRCLRFVQKGHDFQGSGCWCCNCGRNSCRVFPVSTISSIITTWRSNNSVSRPMERDHLSGGFHSFIGSQFDKRNFCINGQSLKRSAANMKEPFRIAMKIGFLSW